MTPISYSTPTRNHSTRDWFFLAARVIGLWCAVEGAQQIAAAFILFGAPRGIPQATPATRAFVMSAVELGIAWFLLFRTTQLVEFIYGRDIDHGASRETEDAPQPEED